MFENYKKTLIALVFARVEFKDSSLIDGWNFDKLINEEFYVFDSFTQVNLPTLGLATYGIVKDLNI